jgi:hypothetical protein
MVMESTGPVKALPQAIASRSTAVVSGAYKAQQHYRPQKGWKLDPVAGAAPKQLARRYYQLKVGHAAIPSYLSQIGIQDSPRCQSCQAPPYFSLLFPYVSNIPHGSNITEDVASRLGYSNTRTKVRKRLWNPDTLSEGLVRRVIRS